MIYLVCVIVGFAIGAFVADRRWSRLRMKWYWLRAPHGGE
jgi:uncharacterized protein YneF (UPF0154 family)